MEWKIQRNGRSLNPTERMIANKMNIDEIEKIRVLEVSEITYPLHPIFRLVAKFSQSIFLAPAGMTFKSGILIDEKYRMNLSLIAHELVHVKQYQAYGGHFSFLKEYVHQCLKHGYTGCPLELEANEWADVVRSSRLI